MSLRYGLVLLVAIVTCLVLLLRPALACGPGGCSSGGYGGISAPGTYYPGGFRGNEGGAFHGDGPLAKFRQRLHDRLHPASNTEASCGASSEPSCGVASAREAEPSCGCPASQATSEAAKQSSSNRHDCPCGPGCQCGPNCECDSHCNCLGHAAKITYVEIGPDPTSRPLYASAQRE